MFPKKRMLHSKIWQNSKFISLPLQGRLLYIGLITIADDAGRLPGDRQLLKRHFFPYDRISETKVEELCQQLHDKELIVFYEVGKEKFIFHPKWKKYQLLKIDRSNSSDFPPPPTYGQLTSNEVQTGQDKVSQVSSEEAKVGEVNIIGKDNESISSFAADHRRQEQSKREWEEINRAITESDHPLGKKPGRKGAF